jgi:transmembrane sensor
MGDVAKQDHTVASVTHRLMTETLPPQPPTEYPSLMMGEPPVAPTDPQIRQEAFAWYERLRSPEQAQALWPQFEQWAAQRPEHRAAYLWVERISRDARELAVDCESGKRSMRLFGIPSHRRGRPFRLWMPIVVVSVMLTIGIFLVALDTQADADFETERGKQETVTLADHSVVTLNTNTRLHVRFTLMRRELQLLRGQALFQVYRDWFRPFYVQANDTAVKATGTRFGMHLKNDGDVETAVAEGEVTITPRNAAGPADTPAGDERQILAKAGETVTVTPAGHTDVTNAGKSGVERELKWREGKIAFEQGTLAQWVEEFDRYNHRTFQIDDERIAQLPITGEFKATDPDTFAGALQATYGIQARLNDADDVIHLRLPK